MTDFMSPGVLHPPTQQISPQLPTFSLAGSPTCWSGPTRSGRRTGAGAASATIPRAAEHLLLPPDHGCFFDDAYGLKNIDQVGVDSQPASRPTTRTRTRPVRHRVAHSNPDGPPPAGAHPQAGARHVNRAAQTSTWSPELSDSTYRLTIGGESGRRRRHLRHRPTRPPRSSPVGPRTSVEQANAAVEAAAPPSRRGMTPAERAVAQPGADLIEEHRREIVPVPQARPGPRPGRSSPAVLPGHGPVAPLRDRRDANNIPAAGGHAHH